MRRFALTAAIGAACLGLAACSGGGEGNEAGNNAAGAAEGEGNGGGAAAGEGNGAGGGGNNAASADWPRGTRIVEENGVAYRVDANGTRVRLGEGDARIVVENGVRYRVDPSGTRVRINEQGIDLDVDTPDIDVDTPDVDVGVNNKGNLDIDVGDKDKDGGR